MGRQARQRHPASQQERYDSLAAKLNGASETTPTNGELYIPKLQVVRLLAGSLGGRWADIAEGHGFVWKPGLAPGIVYADDPTVQSVRSTNVRAIGPLPKDRSFAVHGLDAAIRPNVSGRYDADSKQPLIIPTGGVYQQGKKLGIRIAPGEEGGDARHRMRQELNVLANPVETKTTNQDGPSGPPLPTEIVMGTIGGEARRNPVLYQQFVEALGATIVEPQVLRRVQVLQTQ
jgi:hypothetical protein